MKLISRKFREISRNEILSTNEPSVAEHRSRTRKLAAACSSSSSSQKVNHIGHCQMAVCGVGSEQTANIDARPNYSLLLDLQPFRDGGTQLKIKRRAVQGQTRGWDCIYFGTKSHMSSEIWGTAPVM